MKHEPMKAPLLSVVIPARCEMWLSKTVEDLLAHTSKDTEIIAVCDASWPEPPLKDHPRLTVVHYTEPIGQRGAVNQGVRLSRAKYVAKLDGHSSVDANWDLKLAEPYENGTLRWDCVTIPRLYNLHVWNWICKACKWTTYQGAKPACCGQCKGTDLEMEVVWKPRMDRRTDFSIFDSELHFQYDPRYEKRPQAQGDIVDVMSSVGACFFMRRDWFRKFGCLDEITGMWGQFGTEVSCRTWLSGGRQVVNKNTFYSHYFRLGGYGFPYPISGNDQERARIYSRDYWRNNRWKGQKRPLHWLVEKFWPVKGWTQEELEKIQAIGRSFGVVGALANSASTHPLPGGGNSDGGGKPVPVDTVGLAAVHSGGSV